MDKSRLNIEDIIRKSLLDQKALQKEYRLFGKLLYVQEPFIGDVDVQNVINDIEYSIPPHLFEEVDTIIVGAFDFLEERDLEAIYKDGAIYISSKIINSRDLLENILHEMAHSLEDLMGYYIYSDGTLQILSSNLIPKFQVVFKDLFPYNLSTLSFDATDTDIEYFTADASFKYTIYSITDLENNPIWA